MTIYTMGFTKKSAEVFFERLRRAGVKRLVDVRLNNVSQLAGFTKRDDLRYFAKAICGIDYEHRVDLAPTAPMLDAFKKEKRSDWTAYEAQFLALLRERRIEATLPRSLVDGGCLLCSEEKPHHCHRRLVAEHLREHWGDPVQIEHLP